MTEAAVSFAGNLTDDPEVRYTEGGIVRRRSGGPSRPAARRRRVRPYPVFT
jgi:single-stranded DNA-binding protein